MRAERRRPAGPGGAKPTGRAETPVRRRPTQPQQPTSSSSYSQPVEDSSYTQPILRRQFHRFIAAQLLLRRSGGLGGLGSLLGLLGKLPKKVLFIGAIFLCVAAVCFVFFILPKLQDLRLRPALPADQTGYEQPETSTQGEETTYNLPTEETTYVQPSAEPITLPQPGTYASDDTWLVMLYQDADDKILEQDIFVDLNEAERVGSSAKVQHRGTDRPLPGRLPGRWQLDLRPALTISPRTTT